jgi:hypothetical protein
LWIYDIVRNGLLNLPGKDPSYFETVARRMIDAQAPGLANMVRGLGEINFYKESWQTPFLDQLVRIYLVLEGFSRLDSLSGALQSEIRNLVGLIQSQDEVKADAGIRDDWFVLAKQIDKEDNLTVERNWLYGIQSKRYALILQFYVKGQIAELNLVPGSSLDAEVCYFKGSSPVRALVKEQFGVKQMSAPAGFETWREIAEATSLIMNTNPFYDSFPIIIEDVMPVYKSQLILKDKEGKGIRVSSQFSNTWKFLAMSGGQPVKIFALGNEEEFTPLGMWVKDAYKILV